MPKQFLKRIMPSEEKLRRDGSLKMLGQWIHNAHLWHFNRRSATRAVLIGGFCAFIPLPIQMFIAAFLCIPAKANLPLSIAFVWITNPITLGPIFYGAYELGALILDIPAEEYVFEMSSEWLKERISAIWKPLLLGSAICGIGFSALSYTVVDVLWRWKTVQKWKKRQAKRNKRHS